MKLQEHTFNEPVAVIGDIHGHADLLATLLPLLGTRKILVTGDGQSLFDPAPQIEPQRLRGRSYAQLVDAHAGAVNSRRIDVVPVGDPLELVRELEQLEIRANQVRGIYVRASPDDVAKVMRKQNG